MPNDSIQRRAQSRVTELPGAVLEFPFGPDWEVYKVRGKVFMLMSEHSDEPIVTLKADPEDSKALREQFSSISPGYHMNKKHWITVRPGTNLPDSLIDDLVTESYLLVVEKLPRAQRPVDPTTFAGLRAR